MKLNYKDLRNLYYGGILLTVLYALPKVVLIQKYLYPIFNFNVIEGLPVITIIALLTLYGAIQAYIYRKIG